MKGCDVLPESNLVKTFSVLISSDRDIHWHCGQRASDYSDAIQNHQSTLTQQYQKTDHIHKKKKKSRQEFTSRHQILRRGYTACRFQTTKVTLNSFNPFLGKVNLGLYLGKLKCEMNEKDPSQLSQKTESRELKNNNKKISNQVSQTNEKTQNITSTPGIH